MTDIKDVRNQRLSLEEYIERENKNRGFDVSIIDKDKFLERIRWGDWSAYYLGTIFCSMYRGGISANLDLTKTSNLDSEGLNFLFKIIFARSAPNWSCDYLYSIEQEVKEILGLTYTDEGLVIETTDPKEQD